MFAPFRGQGNGDGMYGEQSVINIKEVVETDPLDPELGHLTVLRVLVIIGLLAVLLVFYGYPADVAWGALYTNTVFWLGLSAGGVVLAAIFQIVKSRWSAPLRRIAEAHLSFYGFGYALFLISYLGREHIFHWAAEGGMPGRGWWMEIDVMYIRYALLLGLLYFVLQRFVRASLRGDVGLIREGIEPRSTWFDFSYNFLVRNWKGSAHEIPEIQKKLSRLAPVVVIVYSVVFSLFVFDMVMSMDVIWYSNLLGAFIAVGNLYGALIMTALLTLYFSKQSPAYNKTLTAAQLHDMGKLIFGFCMLWGYMVFSQFLPQWYGNLPEETQWMILRTREYPWKLPAWMLFGMCFVIPFVTLLSRDLKKAPGALACAVVIPFLGLWLEKYLIIMPQLSPARVPFGTLDVLLFLGFFGLYVLCVVEFMRRYPYIAVSSIFRERE